MYYYYKVNKQGIPVLGSNGSSTVRIKSPYFVYYEVTSLDTILFSPSGEKYFVKLNSNYKPIPSTLMKGKQPYTRGWKEIIPLCCSEQGPTLPKPDAPTAGEGVDDVANTYNFTLSPGYTDVQHEYRVTGGPWITATSRDIAFGNVTYSGTLYIRVKAIPGVSRAGSIFSTPVSFTATGGNEQFTYTFPFISA